jgi:hypothetical protein
VGEAVIAGLVDAPRLEGALAGLWSVALAGVPGWGTHVRRDRRGARRRGELAAGAARRARARRAARAAGRPGAAPPVAAPRARARARGRRAARRRGAGRAAGVVTAAAGLLLAFVGLREVFGVVLHAAPADARLGRAVAASGEGWAVGGVLVVLLAGLFAGGIALANRAAADERAPTTIDACNGAAALCDRRLDAVVFAGTHNADGVGRRPGLALPAAGARPRRAARRRRARAARRRALRHAGGRPRAHGPDAAARGARGGADARARGDGGAMRVRDRLVGGAEGPRGLYLATAFCELGRAPLDSGLAAVRRFLARRPNEVVLLVVEDYVAPGDLARAFEAAGLAALAYRGRPGDRWPTLRELIARDERLVAMVESGRPGAPWLLPAFAVLQETPYAFASAADTLSCAPNRGGTSGALFQLNHWIQTAPASRPSNAAAVNALDVLLERARRCARARGRAPNVVAVDFYRTGALLRAVRVLNGLERAPAAGGR